MPERDNAAPLQLVDADVATIEQARRDAERQQNALGDSGADVVKWEHQPFVFAGSDPIAAMNKAGEAGWEAVCVIGETPQGPMWMMKRRKRLVQLASSLPPRG